MNGSRVRRSLLAAVTVAALTAACGTTVTGAQNGRGPVGDGLGLPNDTSSTAPVDNSPTGSSVDTTTDTPTTSVSSPALSATSAPTATSSQPAAGPPSTAAATKKPIPVGFTTLPDAGAFFSSFGASTSTGDQNAEIKAAVKWVNEHGGLNGHPIDPKIEALSATSSESYDAQYQALCSKYTQDLHVVAATIVPTGANDNMDACMSRAKTLFITGSTTLHDKTSFQQHPYVVAPSEVTVDGLAQAMTSLVISRNAAKRGEKIGIINYDLRAYNDAINHYVKPMLSAQGVGVIQYSIPPPASTGGIANAVSVDESAELKMKAQNVKTVMFLCSGCLAFFAKSAKTQNYRPSYVFSSLDTPVAGTDDLFTTSFGVGYSPVTQDQYVYNNLKSFTGNPTFDLCVKIEKAAGQATSATALAYAVSLCDAVMSIYNASRANPVEPVTSDSLLKGALSIGTRFPSALSFGTNLSPSQHAGASSYRAMQWSTPCKCLAYYGPKLAFQPI